VATGRAFSVIPSRALTISACYLESIIYDLSHARNNNGKTKRIHYMISEKVDALLAGKTNQEPEEGSGKPPLCCRRTPWQTRS